MRLVTGPRTAHVQPGGLALLSVGPDRTLVLDRAGLRLNDGADPTGPWTDPVTGDVVFAVPALREHYELAGWVLGVLGGPLLDAAGRGDPTAVARVQARCSRAREQGIRRVHPPAGWHVTSVRTTVQSTVGTTYLFAGIEPDQGIWTREDPATFAAGWVSRCALAAGLPAHPDDRVVVSLDWDGQSVSVAVHPGGAREIGSASPV